MRPHVLSLLCLLILTLSAQAQWELQDSHTTASLRGIHNVGGGVAWASGTNGTVLRTEDGGYMWQTCAVPPGAAVELEVGVDTDAMPVGLVEAAVGARAEVDVAEAEDAGAAGAELLEVEELQPAASVAARSAPPVNSPRWVCADSVIP